MKKTNSAAKSADAPAKNGLVVTSDHRNEIFEYWPRPTEIQLAELATRLARSEKIDPKQLVDEAWSIYWASCEKIKADYHEVEKRIREIESFDDDHILDGDELPQPKQFPVSFPEVELLLLPKLKGRTAERASLFREYIFAGMMSQGITLRGGLRPVSYWDFQPHEMDRLRERCKQSIDQGFAKLRSSVFDALEYVRFAGSFARWHARYSQVVKSHVKAVNARKGWEKRRKSGKDKVAPRPKLAALKEILEKPQSGS